MAKYNEVMEKVNLTEEGKTRIRKNVFERFLAGDSVPDGPAGRSRARKLFKILTPALGAAAVVALVLILVKPFGQGQDAGDQVTYYAPNYVESAEALREDSGYPIYDLAELPTRADSSLAGTEASDTESSVTYCSWGQGSEFANITYAEEGILTDYMVGSNVYDHVNIAEGADSIQTVTVGESDVTLYLTPDGYVTCAEWEKDDMEYAITISGSETDEAVGITEEKMTDLIRQTMTEH